MLKVARNAWPLHTCAAPFFPVHLLPGSRPGQASSAGVCACCCRMQQTPCMPRVLPSFRALSCLGLVTGLLIPTSWSLHCLFGVVWRAAAFSVGYTQSNRNGCGRIGNPEILNPKLNPKPETACPSEDIRSERGRSSLSKLG